MKKIFYLFAVLVLFSINLLAVPAYPYPILVTQSDGSQITIRIYGDEWFNYTTTDDGYLLKQNIKGDYEYAKFENNIVVSTGRIARENRSYEENAFLRKIGKNPITAHQAMINSLSLKKVHNPDVYRSLSPNPLFGQKKGLVLLVQFSDKSYTSSTAQQDFTNLLNQPGYSANGGTGSAKDYFKASTFNQFDPTFDVYGPYTLTGTVSSYGENGSSGHGDIGAGNMIKEACRLADGDVNFADYDTDNDGYVDMVFVYYAGVNEAEGGPSNTIWPHKSEIYPTIALDGKTIKVYACTSEKNGRGTMCGVGTFCHEFGHVLGLPDVYNTAPPSGTRPYTVEDWDIMASGSYNNQGRTPPTWLAHEKFFLSYLTPTLLNTTGEKKLPPIITSNKAFILSPPNDNHNISGSNPAPNYFYLIENRQYLGWDSLSPSTGSGRLGKGLLITKINFSQSAWANNTPNNDPTNLRVDVIEADGSNYSYSGDTYPGTANITEFVPKLLAGGNYDGILTSISVMEGDSIAFCFRECLNKARIIVTAPKTSFRTIVGDEPDKATFKIEGMKFENNARLNFTGPKASLFQMRKVGETNWVSTILLEPNATDSTIVADIEVRYNPTVPSYKQQDKATFIARDITGTPKKEIELTASSTRKIKIVPPILNAFTDTTAYSAVANWKKVDDAVGYYLTIYQKNGSTTERETFSDFATNLTSGWNQTFYTTSTSALPSAPAAVLFKNDIDTLWSPYYPQPLNQIKFWLRNEDAKQTGSLYIYGLSNSGWEQIATIKMEVSIDYKTFKYDLDINKNFKRIRFSCADLGKGITIDDFEASYAANVARQRMYINGGETVSAKAEGLNHSTVYYAKIQATDRDPQGNYNNVTNFSNEVELKTLFGSSDPRVMPISYDENGDVVVYLKNEEDKKLDLYVYTLNGVLVQQYKKENYDGAAVAIKNLQPGTTYIISLGAKRKGKFAKVYINPKKR